MIETLNSAEHLAWQSERRSELVAALRPHLPSGAMIWHEEDTTPYECDGLTAYRQRPLVVALPEYASGQVTLPRAGERVAGNSSG